MMLEYDIENTINTIKEHEIYLIKQIDVDGECKNNNITLVKNAGAHQNIHSIARKRWKILAKAIKKNGNSGTEIDGTMDKSSGEQHTLGTEDLLASVRRFGSFDLMQQDHISIEDKEQLLGSARDWFAYKLSVRHIDYTVNIHHVNRPITAVDLMGFNNTGNICVWPSEEALAFYSLTDINNFTNKMVLELGGGMTCLAGLLIAKYANAHGVHLTDGNAMSVENVKKTCRLNDINNCYVKCSALEWEEHRDANASDAEKFDYILSADCLFFDEARDALIDTIWSYLSDTGTALVMAPRRGTTLETFVNGARQKGFQCIVEQRYNETIWQRHLQLKVSSTYDENIHYPILIKLTKTIEIH